MNRREYNIVVDQFANNLFGYAYKFLRSEADAQDIVQDVFEKLWRNRSKVEFPKAKSWMFTTAHNSMINFLNKKGRVQLSGSMQSFEQARNHASSFEAKEIVEKAVAILPPVQKSILLLRDLEGYTYEEIGKILELNEAQVKVYLFRARKKVKKQLKELIELA